MLRQCCEILSLTASTVIFIGTTAIVEVGIDVQRLVAAFVRRHKKLFVLPLESVKT